MQLSKVLLVLGLGFGLWSAHAQSSGSEAQEKALEALRQTRPAARPPATSTAPLAGEEKILQELRQTERAVAPPKTVQPGSADAQQKIREALRKTWIPAANLGQTRDSNATPSLGATTMAQASTPAAPGPSGAASPIASSPSATALPMSPAVREAKKALERYLSQRPSEPAERKTGRKPAPHAPAKAPAQTKPKTARSTQTEPPPSISNQEQPNAPAQTAAPKTWKEQLRELDRLYLQNRITPEEYHQRREKIISEAERNK